MGFGHWSLYSGVHFLLLKVISSVGMGLVLKHSDQRGYARLPVIRVNYAVAAILAFFGAHLAGQHSISVGTAVLGAITGGLFVAGLLFWARTIEVAGLALSIVAMRTAIVLPVLAGIIIWHEQTTLLELVGSGVALVALGLVLSDVWRAHRGKGRVVTVSGRMHSPQLQKRSAPFWLAGLFLVDGLVIGAAQVFRQEMPQNENLPFQVVIFVSAFLITTVIYYLRRARVDQAALKFGALLGAANLGNYLFLVLALTVLPGIVVYPAIAAGEVGLMALAGVFFWREKLGVRSWIGIGLAVAALVLLQVGRASGQ